MNTTLYKKDSRNKIRQLRIYTKGSFLFQESGLIGGKLITQKTKCKAKNIGKINSTTPEEQAISEGVSKVTLKIKEGYFYTQEEASKSVVILPMLAKDYKKEFKKVVFPCFVQPKLDGMRALYLNNELISRKNTKIENLGHILKSLEGIELILDGELYVHGKSFQENMKRIKKNRGDKTKEILYHVYDIVVSESFEKRYEILKEVVKNKSNIKLVQTFKIDNKKELLDIHAKFVEQGYEGTMIRWGDAPYKINGRSSNLLKYKDFIDEIFEVVDVIPSEKDKEKGVVVCKIDNKTFGCGMKFSHEERKEILKEKEKYIGRIAEVRFFEYTEDGIPRFPVCVGFRLDK